MELVEAVRNRFVPPSPPISPSPRNGVVEGRDRRTCMSSMEGGRYPRLRETTLQCRCGLCGRASLRECRRLITS